MAPLVVVLSVALALGISHLASPEGTPLFNPAGPEPTAAPSSHSPRPSPNPTPADTPISPPAGELVELNDASLTVPATWEVASDELVEGDRRAIRLVHPATDVRLQALTLGPSDETPRQACQALVELQRQSYTNVTTQLTLEVSVPSTGQGVACGFDGTRISDEVANAVNFTLLRRDADGHLLMLRATVPESVSGSAEAHSQLVSMQCEASRTFGVRLPLC